MPNNTLSRADLSSDGEILNIHYGDVLIKFGDVLDFNTAEIPFIAAPENLGSKTRYLRDGDIVIADTAEDETVGKTTEMQRIGTRKVVAGLHTIPCRPLERFAEGYLGYYTNAPAFHNQLYSLMQGIKVLSISKSNINKTNIRFPIFDEQKKISEMLLLLDGRIEVQRRLVEALKSYKRGLLAAVFDEDNCILTIDRASWKQCKIGDFLFPRILKQVPTPDAPLMAFTAEGGVCPKGDRYDRSFLVKDENKQYKRTELNDFIYSSNNLDVGSIGLNKYGSAVISDVYEIFTIKGADISFIAEAICRPQTIAKILKYRQGVIYGQYRIYAENFLEVDICLPPIKEQIKYSQLLSKLDDRIVRESTVLKDLSEIRLGLLQRLFI